MVTIIFNLLFLLIRFLSYAIFASAIVSTLLSFNVLDSRNRVVWSIADFLYRVTDPVLRPIRAVLPSFGGVDLSPWLALVLLQVVVAPLLFDLEQAIVLGTPELRVCPWDIRLRRPGRCPWTPLEAGPPDLHQFFYDSQSGDWPPCQSCICEAIGPTQSSATRKGSLRFAH